MQSFEEYLKSKAPQNESFGNFVGNVVNKAKSALGMRPAAAPQQAAQTPQQAANIKAHGSNQPFFDAQKQALQAANMIKDPNAKKILMDFLNGEGQFKGKGFEDEYNSHVMGTDWMQGLN